MATGAATSNGGAENRLKTVSGPVSASYTYDGNGYRVKKTVGSTSGASHPPTFCQFLPN